MSHTDYSGQIIDGRYRIIRPLGKGGMGSVYLGKHIVIGKQVAVKFLHAAFAEREDIIKRFYREAQAAAAIGHKNIIDVMDVGVSTNGEPYLVMEYLTGESLASMLQRAGTIDLAAACGIIEPTLLALSAAHQKGIIHRDLKPDNIFLVYKSGEAPAIKLIDFGISKFSQESNQSHLTRVGVMLGTPMYMSPEQARAPGDIDIRSDLYSMGVILYEMLTGKLPFSCEHYNEWIVNVHTTEPRPPKEAYVDFPAEAEQLVIQTLSKDPANRPQSATEMLDAIRELSGFGQRKESLTVYASSVSQTSFAAGDLGGEVSSSDGADSGNIASDLLSEMAREASTPEVWAGTGTVKGRRIGLLYAGAIGIVVVGIVVAILIIVLGKDRLLKGAPLASPPMPASTEAEPVEPSKGVEITVEGAPKEAVIYYNNSQISVNPFKVKKSEMIAPLRVEAPGYETYRYSVVPSEDQVVKVVLKEKAVVEVKDTEQETETETEKISSSEKRPVSKRRRTSSTRTTRKRHKKKKFIQISGTKVAGEFE